jgi:hypothetical protein
VIFQTVSTPTLRLVPQKRLLLARGSRAWRAENPPASVSRKYGLAACYLLQAFMYKSRETGGVLPRAAAPPLDGVQIEAGFSRWISRAGSQRCLRRACAGKAEARSRGGAAPRLRFRKALSPTIGPGANAGAPSGLLPSSRDGIKRGRRASIVELDRQTKGGVRRASFGACPRLSWRWYLRVKK